MKVAETIADIIAWVVALGVSVWIWSISYDAIIRNEIEAGTKNVLWVLIWPVVLGLFAGFGSYTAAMFAMKSIFFKNRK